MRRPSSLLLVALALAAAAVQAQAPPQTLFERYLESLRMQAGIPGLTAAIVQDGRTVWEGGFGYRDVEALQPALPDTPFPIADLTETFAATLLLQCAERGQVDLTAPVARWSSLVPEPGAEVRHVMAHASEGAPGSGFKFSPARFAALTPVIEACGDEAYRRQLVADLLDRLAMVDSVPGADLAVEGAPARALFDPEDLDRYATVLGRLAVPYRVDRNGKPSRSEYPPPAVDAATGIVSTARDLAKFDAALSTDGLLLPETLAVAWTNAVSTAGTPLPTGLGWFVQAYNGERIVWHFGVMPNAASSLLLHVPGRRLTLVMLANSDGLASSLSEGDVTASPFARLFLRMFLL